MKEFSHHCTFPSSPWRSLILGDIGCVVCFDCYRRWWFNYLSISGLLYDLLTTCKQLLAGIMMASIPLYNVCASKDAEREAANQFIYKIGTLFLYTQVIILELFGYFVDFFSDFWLFLCLFVFHFELIKVVNKISLESRRNGLLLTHEFQHHVKEECWGCRSDCTYFYTTWSWNQISQHIYSNLLGSWGWIWAPDPPASIWVQRLDYRQTSSWSAHGVLGMQTGILTC